MISKRGLISLFLALFPSVAFAQDIGVTAEVVENRSELPPVELSGSLVYEKGNLNFFPKKKDRAAELKVFPKKDQVLFLFEGKGLAKGSYKLVAFKKCPSARELASENKDSNELMSFETQFGEVESEGSSRDFDLDADSENSIFKRKLALVRNSKGKKELVGCSELKSNN